MVAAQRELQRFEEENKVRSEQESRFTQGEVKQEEEQQGQGFNKQSSEIQENDRNSKENQN